MATSASASNSELYATPMRNPNAVRTLEDFLLIKSLPIEVHEGRRTRRKSETR